MATGLDFFRKDDEEPVRALDENGFYSGAAEAARRLATVSGPHEQMLGALRNAKGIKPDELEHAQIGRKVWRHNRKGNDRIHRDDIATMLEEAAPRITESTEDKWHTTYQGRDLYTPGEKNYRELLMRLASHDPNDRVFYGGHYSTPNLLAHIRMSDRVQKPKLPKAPKPTKEFSVRTHDSEVTNEVPAWDTGFPGLSIHKSIGEKGYSVSHDHSGMKMLGGIPTYWGAVNYARQMGPLMDWTEPKEVLLPKFRESEAKKVHSNISQNDLHLEDEFNMPPEDVMKKRGIKKPERYLHIDENQSDWGQQARDQGFGLEGDDRYEMERNMQDARERSNWRLAEEYEKELGKGVPRAPFIDKTQKWTDLTAKRALTEAARGNYDGIMWTPGEKQAERYKLSNFANQVFYDTRNNYLKVLDKNGNVVMSEHMPDREKIAQYIGKEPTAELLKDENKTEHGVHVLQGEGLRVGGHGMINYYNKIYGPTLLKWIKTHDPEAKFETVSIGDKNVEGFPLIRLSDKARESIRKKGFPMFKRGGAVLLGKGGQPDKFLPHGHPQRTENLASFMEGAHPDVLNEDGTPRVFYHGTKRDFSDFKPAYSDNLIFFTTNPQFASKWPVGTGGLREPSPESKEEMGRLRALQKHIESVVPRPKDDSDEEGSRYLKDVRDEFKKRSGFRSPYDYEEHAGTRVMPVHISAKNPFNPKKDWEKIEPFLSKHPKLHGLVSGGHHKSGNWLVYEDKDVINKLKEMGHDAVWLAEDTGGPLETLAAFNPTQVKSATGNRGTYDPKEADINKARGGSAIMKKADGGTIQSTPMAKSLSEMRLALFRRNNPLDVKSVGINEAPDIEPKAYIPPDYPSRMGPPPGGVATSSGMPIGGVDTNKLMPGQQLVPQNAMMPQQANSQTTAPDQSGGQASGQPSGAHAPQSLSNILQMTPQGQTLNAMRPNTPPQQGQQGQAPQGMKSGGLARGGRFQQRPGMDEMRAALRGIRPAGGYLSFGMPAARITPILQQLKNQYRQAMDTGNYQPSAYEMRLAGLTKADTRFNPTTGDQRKQAQSTQLVDSMRRQIQSNPPVQAPVQTPVQTPVTTPVYNQPVSNPSVSSPPTGGLPLGAGPVKENIVDPMEPSTSPPVKNNIVDPEFQGLNDLVITTGQGIDETAGALPNPVSQPVTPAFDDGRGKQVGPAFGMENFDVFASGGSAHFKDGGNKHPAVFPPTQAIKKQEIAQMAERMARQMSGLDNPNQKTLMQLRRERDLPVNIRTLAQQRDLPTIDYAKQKGAHLIGVPGDPSIGGMIGQEGMEPARAAVEIAGIGERQFERPVGQFGGKDYGTYGHPHGWAGNISGVRPLSNVSRRISEVDPEAKILGQFVKMSPESLDFALHNLDTLMAYQQPEKFPKKYKEKLNRMMRAPFAHHGAYPEFPGFDKPEDVMLHAQQNSNLRKKLVHLLSTKRNLPPGTPSAEDVVFAVSHPELRNLETGASGSTILRLDPSVDPASLLSPHPTYSHELPSAAVGRSRYMAPAEIAFPRSIAYAKQQIANLPANKRKSVLPFNMAKMIGMREPIDEQYIQQLGEYEHQMKKRLGYKKGGKVKKELSVDDMKYALVKGKKVV